MIEGYLKVLSDIQPHLRHPMSKVVHGFNRPCSISFNDIYLCKGKFLMTTMIKTKQHKKFIVQYDIRKTVSNLMVGCEKL